MCVCGRADAVGPPEPRPASADTPIRLALQRGPPGLNQRSRSSSDVRDPSRSVLRAGSPITRAARRRAPDRTGRSVRMASRVLASSRSIRLRIAHSHKLLLRAATGHLMSPVTAAGPWAALLNRHRGFELSADAMHQSRASPRRGVLPLIRLLSPETRRHADEPGADARGFQTTRGLFSGDRIRGLNRSFMRTLHRTEGAAHRAAYARASQLDASCDASAMSMHVALVSTPSSGTLRPLVALPSEPIGCSDGGDLPCHGAPNTVSARCFPGAGQPTLGSQNSKGWVRLSGSHRAGNPSHHMLVTFTPVRAAELFGLGWQSASTPTRCAHAKLVRHPENATVRSRRPQVSCGFTQRRWRDAPPHIRRVFPRRGLETGLPAVQANGSGSERVRAPTDCRRIIIVHRWLLRLLAPLEPFVPTEACVVGIVVAFATISCKRDAAEPFTARKSLLNQPIGTRVCTDNARDTTSTLPTVGSTLPNLPFECSGLHQQRKPRTQSYHHPALQRRCHPSAGKSSPPPCQLLLATSQLPQPSRCLRRRAAGAYPRRLRTPRRPCLARRGFRRSLPAPLHVAL